MNERGGLWRPVKRERWAMVESVWYVVPAGCRARQSLKESVKSKRVSHPSPAASAGPERDASPLRWRTRGWWSDWKKWSMSKPGVTRSLRCVGFARARGPSRKNWPGTNTPVSHTKVAQILHALDYSLQSNRKTEEGKDHPDRDAQFRHISATARTMPEGRQSGHFRGYQEERTPRQLR